MVRAKGEYSLKKVSYILFDQQPIRDTKYYYPLCLIDLGRAIAWGFEVENSTDQIATCDLIGGSLNVPAGVGTLGSNASVTVAAGAVAPIATNIWLPFLGVRVSFGTSPTVNYIKVTGWVQEKAD